MIRFFKDSFGMIVGIVMALMISFSMAIVGAVRSPMEQFSMEMLLRNWGTAFLTITVVSILFPVKSWGDQLAIKLGVKTATLPFGLVSNLVPTFFFNTITTCVMVGINVDGGFASVHYWAGVRGDYLSMFVTSYLLSLAAEKIGRFVAMRAGLNSGIGSPFTAHNHD